MAATSSLHKFDFLFKTIVVGDGAVGKTAITVRYASGKFEKNYKMTIGVDFTVKEVEVGKKLIKCQIWDTGGQEKFSKIRPLYYRGALGAVVVYDVTNRDSFANLDQWFGEIKEYCVDIPVVIVGNKIDLEGHEVLKEEGEEYAKKKSKELGMSIPFLETSAKTGESVNKLFDNLIKAMVKVAEKNLSDEEDEEA